MGTVPGSIGFTPGENGESENGKSGIFILLFSISYYFFGVVFEVGSHGSFWKVKIFFHNSYRHESPCCDIQNYDTHISRRF